MQDDWHVNKKLTVNLGLRYEFTLPPVAGGDQYSDFSPTNAESRGEQLSGRFDLCGNGAGRQGTSSLIPGWYGAWGPRLGVAYALNPQDHNPRRRSAVHSAV